MFGLEMLISPSQHDVTPHSFFINKKLPHIPHPLSPFDNTQPFQNTGRPRSTYDKHSSGF